VKRILLAAPRGFCAGVDRAIEIVERAIEKFGAPVYVRHEIVHNRFVVDSNNSVDMSRLVFWRGALDSCGPTFG
jgi:4-hydroxy-3-methylbut-2-enyl diphosphate reductase IspH